MGRPSEQTLKRLFGLSGNECYMPSCTEQLVFLDEAEVLGVVAHIRAQRPGGPRSVDGLDDAVLHSFENLIVLCPTCHAKVDRIHIDRWPIHRLEEIKRVHEDRRSARALKGSDLDLVVELVTTNSWLLTTNGNGEPQSTYRPNTLGELESDLRMALLRRIDSDAAPGGVVNISIPLADLIDLAQSQRCVPEMVLRNASRLAKAIHDGPSELFIPPGLMSSVKVVAVEFSMSPTAG